MRIILTLVDSFKDLNDVSFSGKIEISLFDLFGVVCCPIFVRSFLHSIVTDDKSAYFDNPVSVKLQFVVFL